MTKRRDFQRLLQTRLRPSWEYCTSVATGGKKNLVSLDLKEIYDHKHKETWEFFASVKLKQNPSYVHWHTHTHTHFRFLMTVGGHCACTLSFSPVCSDQSLSSLQTGAPWRGLSTDGPLKTASAAKVPRPLRPLKSRCFIRGLWTLTPGEGAPSSAHTVSSSTISSSSSRRSTAPPDRQYAW